MKEKNRMKIIVLTVLVSLASKGAFVDFDMFAPLVTTQNCEILDEELWNVIEWFFGSSNLVSIYFIHPHKPNGLQFDLLRALLEEIPKSE